MIVRTTRPGTTRAELGSRLFRKSFVSKAGVELGITIVDARIGAMFMG